MTSSRTLSIDTLMSSSGVQFGTSGARGLVSAMTDQVCYAYTCAFLQHLKSGSNPLGINFSVAIAGDLRSSSPRIMNAVAAAVRDQGGQAINCGHIPSPAVAYFGLQHKIPSIMVTGSHIPDDRNGIKFNSSLGEILKEDELGIKAQEVTFAENCFDEQGMFTNSNDLHALPKVSDEAYTLYVSRYLNFFPKDCLANKTIGLYEHSTVGRDIFRAILEGLGAKVKSLGRSDNFISVDTEAIRPEDVALARDWAQESNYDAIVSADGDADRPLISDEYGEWFRGDIAGILTAEYLDANYVSTPVSSNTALEKSRKFRTISRTKIGSPYVIASMQQAKLEDTVVGYEANGGFLLGTEIKRDTGSLLLPLPTRDAIIVPLSLLMLAQDKGLTLSQLATTLPPRFTASDRAKNFPTEKSKEIIASFLSNNQPNFDAINDCFSSHFDSAKTVDITDGLRITFENQEVAHLRPSGNAPEFRCYNEADSAQRAKDMNQLCMQLIESWK